MVEKNLRLQKITSDEAERLTLARLLDQREKALRRNIPTATNFLTPREQELAKELLTSMGALEEGIFRGGYEGAERQIALFLPDYLDEKLYEEDEEFPICAVRCHYRVEDRPTHRDFLGSLMGLGIRREMVGDLLVSEGSCDLLLRREIRDFVLQNYVSSGRTHVKTEAIPLAHLHLPEQQRQEIVGTVAALRLDSVVAVAFRLSRTKAAEQIRSGRVEVNWRPCEKGDHTCAEGDRITVRGLGKCTLKEIGGLSKKGRITIRAERYR